MADDAPRSAVTTPLSGNGLTPEDRLSVSLHAQAIARQLLTLKVPARRAVLEQVRWVLGDE